MASQPLSSIRSRLHLYFLKHSHGLGGFLSQNIVREVCLYLVADVYLPFLDYKKDTLVLVCAATMGKRLKTEVGVMGSCYCLMDYCRVFYLRKLGEGEEKGGKTAVWRTDLMENEEIGEMSALRAFPTVLKHQNYVYIFAGNTKKCEKLSIWDHQFTPLPLKSPIRFSKAQGCLCLNKLYIAVQGPAPTILQFNPANDCFEGQFLSSITSNAPLLISLVGEVVHFDSFYVCRWAVTSSRAQMQPAIQGNLLQVCTSDLGWTYERSADSLSLTCPVRDGHRLYFFSGWTEEQGVKLTVFEEAGRRVESKVIE